MAVNYEKELLHILESTSFSVLPSQEAINANPRVAHAVWKNYLPHGSLNMHGDFNFSKWYDLAEWKGVLGAYSYDTAFWGKALGDLKLAATVLLHEPFQRDFPAITDYYLKDNNKLRELLFSSKNDSFLDLIKLPPNEKEDLKVYYQLEVRGYVDPDVIKKYESDSEFVTKLLEKHQDYFKYLDESNRANGDYIELALSNRNSESMNNLFYLSPCNREKYFPRWLKSYGNNVLAKDMVKYNDVEQNKILNVRPDLLQPLLIKNYNKYKRIGYSFLQEDLFQHIKSFNVEQLGNLFKEYSINPILEKLERYVTEYWPSKNTSVVEKNCLFLVRLMPELDEKLKNNFVYQVNQLALSGEILNQDKFYELVRGTVQNYEEGKVNLDGAESLIGTLMSRLPNEIKKELRIPGKEKFLYLRSEILAEKLSESLPTNPVKSPRVKI